MSICLCSVFCSSTTTTTWAPIETSSSWAPSPSDIRLVLLLLLERYSQFYLGCCCCCFSAWARVFKWHTNFFLGLGQQSCCSGINLLQFLHRCLLVFSLTCSVPSFCSLHSWQVKPLFSTTSSLLSLVCWIMTFVSSGEFSQSSRKRQLSLWPHAASVVCHCCCCETWAVPKLPHQLLLFFNHSESRLFMMSTFFFFSSTTQGTFLCLCLQ